MPLPSQVKMFLPMVLMWGYNKVGQDLPVNGIRAAYAFSQIFALAASLYAWQRAEATASTTETVTAKMKQPTGPEKVEQLTVKEYDIKEAKGAIGRLVTGAAICIGLHSWKGFLQPLVIQAVMGIILVLEDPLFRIYVLGNKPVGALKRPFKKDVSPFAALLGGQDKQEDAPATVDEGEEAAAADAVDEHDAPTRPLRGPSAADDDARPKRNLKKIR